MWLLMVLLGDGTLAALVGRSLRRLVVGLLVGTTHLALGGLAGSGSRQVVARGVTGEEVKALSLIHI